MKANIVCTYNDESVSEAIASAISPDNLDSPEGVKITTKRRGERVESEVEMEGEIETLLATLDDLLSCTSTAEQMI